MHVLTYCHRWFDKCVCVCGNRAYEFSGYADAIPAIPPSKWLFKNYLTEMLRFCRFVKVFEIGAFNLIGINLLYMFVRRTGSIGIRTCELA